MNFWSKVLSIFGLGAPRRRPNSTSRGKDVINMESFWQGRHVTYKNEWSSSVKGNARELVQRVNMLLNELNVVSVHVTSGWRPRAVNKRIGGARNSYHIKGMAVDLRDNHKQEFAKLILKNSHLLHKYQLWIEHPRHTKGRNTNWVHLDIGHRNERDVRVFNP